MIVNGSRIEVKTKRTTAPPQGNYNCTVADFNIHQDCDYYIFVRIMDTLEKGWILGMIDKDKFFKKAKFKRQGDPEEGFIFKADCYNLEIQNLIDDTYFKIDY